jgi:hypothetical protein
MAYRNKDLEEIYGVPVYIAANYNAFRQLTHYLCLHGTSRQCPEITTHSARNGFRPLVTIVPAAIGVLRYMVSDLAAELGADR